MIHIEYQPANQKLSFKDKMKRRKVFQATLSLLVILLSACQLSFLSRRSKPAADMQIKNAAEISIENAAIMDRSPDGKWLIVYTYPEPPYSEFCIYASADLSAVFCMPETDESGITLQPVAWSPDSRKLALVEHMVDVPVDTDIWVLNIETAHLEDITQDRVSGILTASMENVPFLDNAPTWSPDGIWIGFSRTMYDAASLSYETALCKVPALGGEVEKIMQISEEPVAIQNGMLAWLADNRLIYTLREQSMSGRPLGLTAVQVSGDQAPQLLEQLDSDVISSRLMSVSPDSRYALVLHEIEGKGNVIYAFIQVHNLTTGQSSPLKQPLLNDIPAWFSRSNWAVCSPDSSKIGYIYESKTPTTQWRLAIVDIGSEEEVVLKTFDARNYYINHPLRWGEDDTLMIRLVEEEPPFPIQLLTVK